MWSRVVGGRGGCIPYVVGGGGEGYTMCGRGWGWGSCIPLCGGGGGHHMW